MLMYRSMSVSQSFCLCSCLCNPCTTFQVSLMFCLLVKKEKKEVWVGNRPVLALTSTHSSSEHVWHGFKLPVSNISLL